MGNSIIVPDEILMCCFIIFFPGGHALRVMRRGVDFEYGKPSLSAFST